MCPPPPAWRLAARALLAAALLACAAAALAELWLGAGLLRAADGLSAGALGVLKRPLLPPPVAAPRGKGAAPPPPSPWPPTPLARQRRVAARTCGPTAAYVADAARRYAAPGEAGVLVFDWRCVSVLFPGCATGSSLSRALCRSGGCGCVRWRNLGTVTDWQGRQSETQTLKYVQGCQGDMSV